MFKLVFGKPNAVLIAFLCGLFVGNAWQSHNIVSTIAETNGTQPAAKPVKRQTSSQQQRANDTDPRNRMPLDSDSVDSDPLANNMLSPPDDNQKHIPAAERLEKLERLVADPNALNWENLSANMRALALEAENDPATRKLIFDRLATNAGTPLEMNLISMLGFANNPEFETEAIRLAETGNTLSQRLAGLKLLSHMEEKAEETRAALVAMLKGDTAVESSLTLAVLSALTRDGATSLNEQQSIVNQVKPLIGNTDAKIRAQGLNVLADWAPQDPDVQRSIIESTRDSDPSVRLTAAQVLGQNGFRFAEVREALLTTMQNPNEAQDVREAASRSLAAYPLDDQAYRAYTEFKNSLATLSTSVNK